MNSISQETNHVKGRLGGDTKRSAEAPTPTMEN